MWRWLGLFLLTPCVYAEDACASIAGDASRMRCYKRQAASQKKAPTQQPSSVPNAQASVNASKASSGSSNGLRSSLPTTQSKMPTKEPGASSSKTGNAYQGTRTHTPTQDVPSTRPIDNLNAPSMRPLDNLNASGLGSHSESSTSSVGSVSSNAPESPGFYAYENDLVGTDGKASANHTKASKQGTASSSQHNVFHTESASARSQQPIAESSSHAMGQQAVEVLDVNVFHHNNVQGGADDTLPSIQGTWGE